MTSEEMSLLELNNMQTAKFKEINEINVLKLSNLEKMVNEKNGIIQKLNENLKNIKNDFDYNLELLKERDKDLETYDKEFDKIELLLKEKEIVISNLEKDLNEMKGKLSNERSKRISSEEIYKDTINQLKLTSKEEIKKLTKDLENKNKEIQLIHETHLNEIKSIKLEFEKKIEKNSLNMNEDIGKVKSIFEKDIVDIKNEKNELIEKLNKIEKEYANLKNENITLYKDKCDLEFSLKKKNDSNEITILELRSKIEILNEKIVYLSTENENMKREYKESLKKTKDNSKSNSSFIESYQKKVQELSEKVLYYQLEYEKISISEKNLNEKLLNNEENHLETIKSIRNEYNNSKTKLESELKSIKDELKIKNEEILSLRDSIKTKEFEYKEALKILDSKGNSNNKEFENLLKANQELKEIIELALNSKNVARSVNQNKNQSIILDNKFQLANEYFSNPDNQLDSILEKSTGRIKEITDNHQNEMRNLKQRYEDEISNYKMLIEAVNSELEEFKRNGLIKFKEEIAKKENDLILSNERIAGLERQLREFKDSSDENLNLKNTILKKENEILDIKQYLVSVQKENLKIKSDRERLSKICSDLRKEINRLENNIKQLQRESIEEDEENQKNNEEMLFYESPAVITQSFVPHNNFKPISYEIENLNEDKIKFYTDQIEKLKSQSKDLENKFRFSKNNLEVNKSSDAKNLLNKVVNKQNINNRSTRNLQDSRISHSKSKSKSPSLERFNKNTNRKNLKNTSHVDSNINQDNNELIKFEPEFIIEPVARQTKNDEKKALIDNVKEKIIKRSSKPKSIVRNYGIKDDNDPSAIKKLYDN